MIVAPPVPVPAVQDTLPAVASFEEIAEWVEPVRAMLSEKLGAGKMAALDALLQETGAVIAGGSILRAVSPWNVEKLPGRNTSSFAPEVNDLDIYAPVRSTPRLIDGLFTNEETPIISDRDAADVKVLPASNYCESFLRKNGIRRVHTFKVLPAIGVGAIKEIDVMSVRHRRSVQQVVTNFDLTICQIWYNGVKVYATHPQHIREKKGTLQSDYVISLMRGNKFIRTRLQKYMKRGFSISVEGMAENFELLPTDDYFCKKGENRFRSRKNKPEFWNKWYASVATKWLSQSYNLPFSAIVKYNPSIPDSQTPSNNIFVPLAQNFPYFTSENEAGLHIVTKKKYGYKTILTKRFWENYQDTGYDSEDYENERNREALAVLFMKSFYPDINWKNQPQLSFHLAMNKFLENQMIPLNYRNYDRDIMIQRKVNSGFTLGTFYYKHKGLLQIFDDRDYSLRSLYMTPDVINLYLNELVNKSIRINERPLQFSDSWSRVYDIHAHPLNAGISADMLKKHLRRYKKFPKDNIPCYWKDCGKKLTLSEIHYILGPKEFKAWFNKEEGEPMWRGFTQSDLSLMEAIFSDEPNEAKNFSCCPVCLSYVRREDGCMYMHHKCPDLQTPYSQDLYNKYKDRFNNIWWCTLCGRICQDHRRPGFNEIVPAHHALGPADGPRTDLIVPGRGANPFSNDCIPYGGGMLLEKFMRFQKIRSVAKELMPQAGQMTLKDAKHQMITQVWDSVLNITPEEKARLETLLAEKRFNLPTSEFPIQPAPIPETNNNNNLIYPNIPYNIGSGADILLPDILEEGYNVTSLEDERPVLQFKHKKRNGEINRHEGEYISVKNFFELLERQNAGYKDERFGMCWNFPVCDAQIHPQEVAFIIKTLKEKATQYPEITDEDITHFEKIYNIYKNRFNRRFYVQSGGRRTRRRQRGGENETIAIDVNEPFFVEATDAQCKLPRSTNTVATPATRKRKTFRKKRATRRHR